MAAARAGYAKEAERDAQVEAMLDVLDARCGLYAFDKKQHIQVFDPDDVMRFLTYEVACS